MTKAIDALSTSSPPAATVQEGDTPIFAVFRRWADTWHWATRQPFTSDAENNRISSEITRCEREIAGLAAIDPRDLACLAWVTLAGELSGSTKADPCGIDCGDNDPGYSVPARAFAEGVKALYPEIAAILAGRDLADAVQ